MLQFDQATHTYTYLGKVIPSVTQVLDRVGVKDSRGYWNAIGGNFGKDDQVAADFGTAFHAVVAMLEKGIDCEYDPQMQPWVDQYRRFRQKYPPGEILAIEQPMVHADLGFAGTADLVEWRDGVIYVWDWKTAEAVSKSWPLQLAGYSLLVKQHLSLKSNAKIMLRTVRFTRDAFLFDSMNDPLAENQFRSVLNTYNLGAKE